MAVEGALDPDKRRFEEAATWLARLPAATPREHVAFARWHDDPTNAAAYAEAQALWHLTGPAASQVAARQGAHHRPPPRTAARRAPWLVSASVCLLLLGGGVWLERPTLVQDAFADIATARGEGRRLTLPDGSTVELAADNALDIAFTLTERRVRLRRGAAWFAVRHAELPFIVEAAGGEVRVLGTEFELDLLAEEATLTVTEGRVAVRAGTGAQALLGRGQRLRFGPRGVGAVGAVAAEEAAAWRGGRLIFHQAKLAEVVQTLGRYRPGRIIIADRALAERRVSANLPAGDTDAALASLRATLGFRQTELTAHLVILR
jgi:transmembrane sensor